MEWTDEVIAKLRQLWAEGHSTAEIGRRIGVTKNAVVGKVHRLQLVARPSPIRRDGPSARPPRRPAGPRRVIGPTLPSMAAITVPPPRPLTPPPSQRPPCIQQAAERSESVVSRPPPDVRPASPVRAVPGTRNNSRLVTCCWPIGEPGTPSFRFCDADALLGKPYCGEHAQLAYVKVRDRREEVA
jgi:GcrA cell cycle regulator